MRREAGQYKPWSPAAISQSELHIPGPRDTESMGPLATLVTMALMLMVTAKVGRGYMVMQEDMDREDDAVLQQLAELSTRYCQPHLMKSINYR